MEKAVVGGEEWGVRGGGVDEQEGLFPSCCLARENRAFKSTNVTRGAELRGQ